MLSALACMATSARIPMLKISMAISASSIITPSCDLRFFMTGSYQGQMRVSARLVSPIAQVATFPPSIVRMTAAAAVA